MTEANDASETTTTAPQCPPFARSYPEDPQLVTLLAAFDRGDYAVVREGSTTLAATTADPRIKAAALDLRRRVDPDLVSAALLLAGLALALFVGGHFLFSTSEHHDPPAPPTTATARP